MVIPLATQSQILGTPALVIDFEHVLSLPHTILLLLLCHVIFLAVMMNNFDLLQIKNIQGELKLKETIIDDQRKKIEKAQAGAKKYRNKLIKTNREITTQYMNKCAEYKAQMQENIEESKKEAFAKIKQLEQYYEEREKELKKKTNKKKHII